MSRRSEVTRRGCDVFHYLECRCAQPRSQRKFDVLKPNNRSQITRQSTNSTLSSGVLQRSCEDEDQARTNIYKLLMGKGDEEKRKVLRGYIAGLEYSLVANTWPSFFHCLNRLVLNLARLLLRGASRTSCVKASQTHLIHITFPSLFSN